MERLCEVFRVAASNTDFGFVPLCSTSPATLTNARQQNKQRTQTRQATNPEISRHRKKERTRCNIQARRSYDEMSGEHICPSRRKAKNNHTDKDNRHEQPKKHQTRERAHQRTDDDAPRILYYQARSSVLELLELSGRRVWGPGPTLDPYF